MWALWRDFPFMGKCKLRVLLLREAVNPGESTVGRILARRGAPRPRAALRLLPQSCEEQAAAALPGPRPAPALEQRPRQPGELVYPGYCMSGLIRPRIRNFRDLFGLDGSTRPETGLSDTVSRG